MVPSALPTLEKRRRPRKQRGPVSRFHKTHPPLVDGFLLFLGGAPAGARSGVEHVLRRGAGPSPVVSARPCAGGGDDEILVPTGDDEAELD